MDIESIISLTLLVSAILLDKSQLLGTKNLILNSLFIICLSKELSFRYKNSVKRIYILN
ncbi:MAG: hypothetical protein K0Q49_978 [Haloplasmataceae bacterium]|jgi:hypothetical protein|nr:hypothetical protein [Haloplasmataceae bacterium]